jgi:hypothetical protein
MTASSNAAKELKRRSAHVESDRRINRERIQKKERFFSFNGVGTSVISRCSGGNKAGHRCFVRGVRPILGQK